MGTVYWITGLSGAGKTTIGKLLYEKIREEHLNTVFLVGDTLRKVFGNEICKVMRYVTRTGDECNLLHDFYV